MKLTGLACLNLKPFELNNVRDLVIDVSLHRPLEGAA